MSDPLSVAASVAGLISITVEAVKFLSPYVSAAKETPQVEAHVYSEVQSTQVILMGLQNLTKSLGSVKVQHAVLIGVDQIVAILTDGVLLYSELHKELQSLRAKDGMEKVPLRGRLQWVWKENTFITLLSRLQSFKSSMALVLMILQRYVHPATPGAISDLVFSVTLVKQQKNIRSSSPIMSKFF
jgi:cell division control protein 24